MLIKNSFSLKSKLIIVFNKDKFNSQFYLLTIKYSIKGTFKSCIFFTSNLSIVSSKARVVRATSSDFF